MTDSETSHYGPYKGLITTAALGAFVATGTLICARNPDLVTDPDFMFATTALSCCGGLAGGSLFKLGGVIGELVEAIGTIKTGDTSGQGDGVLHGTKGLIGAMAFMVAGFAPMLYFTDKLVQEGAPIFRKEKAKTELPMSQSPKPS